MSLRERSLALLHVFADFVRGYTWSAEREDSSADEKLMAWVTRIVADEILDMHDRGPKLLAAIENFARDAIQTEAGAGSSTATESEKLLSLAESAMGGNPSIYLHDRIYQLKAELERLRPSPPISEPQTEEKP